MHKAVKTSGKSLQFASDHLREDGEVVKAAVTKSDSALKFARGGLNHDSEKLKTARLRLRTLSGLGHRRTSKESSKQRAKTCRQGQEA